MTKEQMNETILLFSNRLQILEKDFESFLVDFEQFKNSVINRTGRIEDRLYRAKKNLTIAEASEYTGFSTHTIYQLTSTRKIKFFKPNGKKIFIPKKDLDNWMASNIQNAKEGIEELKKLEE